MEARAAEWLRDHTYRLYVTDALKVLGDFNERYIDLLDGKMKKTETRTADEIVGDIRGKLSKLQGR